MLNRAEGGTRGLVVPRPFGGGNLSAGPSELQEFAQTRTLLDPASKDVRSERLYVSLRGHSDSTVGSWLPRLLKIPTRAGAFLFSPRTAKARYMLRPYIPSVKIVNAFLPLPGTSTFWRSCVLTLAHVFQFSPRKAQRNAERHAVFFAPLAAFAVDSEHVGASRVLRLRR